MDNIKHHYCDYLFNSIELMQPTALFNDQILIHIICFIIFTSAVTSCWMSSLGMVGWLVVQLYLIVINFMGWIEWRNKGVKTIVFCFLSRCLIENIVQKCSKASWTSDSQTLLNEVLLLHEKVPRSNNKSSFRSLIRWGQLWVTLTQIISVHSDA